MEVLRSQIYRLTEELRVIYNWGLEDTEKFKQKKQKLIKLQQKLDKANQILEKYLLDIRKKPYWG
tara:strand:+ start:59 stop:253 length:195 start_codon:yes stop_codon:yes gene_type:complete